MRVTGPLLKVLQELLAEPQPVYGFDLLRRTRLKSGTVYPLLDRLENAGWVTSNWEEINTRAEGRPRRRFYSLTGQGAHEARQVLVEHGVRGMTWAL
jgi:PadR family transcriptional regulator PadR